MASYTVIADVGKSIVELLRAEMVPEPLRKASMIDLCTPENSNVRLGVFLYSVEENRDYFNNPRFKDKLGLDLNFLFTAYSSTDDSSRIVDEHMIIGKVLEIMNANRVLTSSHLQGSARNDQAEIKMRFISLSADDMSKVWNFQTIPYKCSVAFKVGPVFINGESSGLMSRVR